MPKKLRKCANCKKSFEPREEGGGLAFCSDRCRMVDLGRWLTEEYKISENSPDEEPAGTDFAVDGVDVCSHGGRDRRAEVDRSDENGDEGLQETADDFEPKGD